MSAKLVAHNGNEVAVQFTVKLTGRMLDDEQTLQHSLNEAGQIVMGRCLRPIPMANPSASMVSKHTAECVLHRRMKLHGPVEWNVRYQHSGGGCVAAGTMPAWYSIDTAVCPDGIGQIRSL
jgi:hypothetical protein